MKDVANKAEVSIATVSHVINGTRFVTPETKERVRRAMDSLGYFPNEVAHSLRTKKTKTIGLLVPIGEDQNSNIFIMQIVLGIDSVLREKGYFTLLTNTREDLDREKEEMRHMLTRQTDGLIVIPSIGDHGFMREVAEQKDIVFVDRIPEGLESCDYVVSDAFGGCYEAVSKMIAYGHERIGVLCAQIGKYPHSDERLQGYRKALSDHGLPAPEQYICECDSTMQDGYEKTKRLLKEAGVTAIFTVSNLLGMGAVKYLKEAEIRIREDISLTIFDDYTWTDIYNPSIATIRQDAFAIGCKGAKLLLQKIESGEKAPVRMKLPTQLIIRESWKKLN